MIQRVVVMRPLGVTLRVDMAGNLKVSWSDIELPLECAWTHVVQRHGKAPRRKICMKVMNGVRWLGSPYWSGKAWRSEYRCMVRLGKLHDHPELSIYEKYEDMPKVWQANWKEHICALATHELWHLFCKQPRGRPAEFECETVKKEAVDEYRHWTGSKFTPPDM